MSTYIECKTCGNYTIEILGDQELGCEYCMNKETEE
jgi:DNA-directed RNA polymerase subunit RPC12/RpoP